MMDHIRFEALLPDYLEETLTPDLRADVDAHRAACARCRALVDDLELIVRDAAALPAIEPSRDLWAGIAQRIEAPVVALGTGRAAPPVRRIMVTRRWLSAAAAALVVGSVGATYAVLRLSDRGASTPLQTAVSTPPTQRTEAPSATAAPASIATMPDEAPVRPAGARLASARPENAVTTYDAEIRSLRAVLRRRTDLDSSTVVVIERSLRVIDDAIAQSRTALARDPNSRLLGDQLTRALDQKVELLRTAILLPASS